MKHLVVFYGCEKGFDVHCFLFPVVYSWGETRLRRWKILTML